MKKLFLIWYEPHNDSSESILNEKYESETLFSSIKGRLPSHSRPDFNELMKTYGIKNPNDEFEILEKTNGKVSTDNFIFVTQEELIQHKK